MKNKILYFIIPKLMYLLYGFTFIYSCYLNIEHISKIENYTDFYTLEVVFHALLIILIFHNVKFTLSYVKVYKEYLRKLYKIPKVILLFSLLLILSSCSNDKTNNSGTLFIIENSERVNILNGESNFDYTLSSYLFKGNQTIYLNSKTQWAVGDTIKLVNIRLERDSIINAPSPLY